MKDTVNLLRECDAGVKMGIRSIDDVLSHVKSDKLKKMLADCKESHERIETEIEKELTRFGASEKKPNIIAEGMSWMKSNMKLAVKDGDKTVAGLMTDGCNMGVKSLSKYLNQYEAAEEYSKDIAKKLISIESDLAIALRSCL